VCDTLLRVDLLGICNGYMHIVVVTRAQLVADCYVVVVVVAVVCWCCCFCICI